MGGRNTETRGKPEDIEQPRSLLWKWLWIALHALLLPPRASLHPTECPQSTRFHGREKERQRTRPLAPDIADDGHLIRSFM